MTPSFEEIVAPIEDEFPWGDLLKSKERSVVWDLLKSKERSVVWDLDEDEEMDRIISGVYNGVLPALAELDLNTESDDLQELVEDFADRVWEWFNVKDD